MMWLNDVFSANELESKTKSLYFACRENVESMVDLFEKYFGVSYKIAFGNEKPDDCINELLKEYYPNEHFVKNEFSKKYLKECNPIFEYPIGESRADIIDVKENLSCYEIKTKYDNLNRLNKQLKDYSMVFEYNYVVCSEDKYNDVLNSIDETYGIITYKDRKNCAFVKKRKALKSPYLNIDCILGCCYKKELINSFKTSCIEEIKNKYSRDEIICCYREILKNRYKSI